MFIFSPEDRPVSRETDCPHCEDIALLSNIFAAYMPYMVTSYCNSCLLVLFFLIQWHGYRQVYASCLSVLLITQHPSGSLFVKYMDVIAVSST